MSAPATPVPADPLALVVADRERARAAGDPFVDLCVLATAGTDAVPGVRPIVLRDVGPDGVGLLVSATSLKWAPLAHGHYECLLVWLTIRRQYRIRGGLTSMPEARLQAYWEQKVHASRLLDVYYRDRQPQSSVVASRDRFLADIEELRRRHPTPESVPRPDGLRGIYLVPERIEAWRGSPDRLHDRRRFTRTTAGWIEETLVP